MLFSFPVALFAGLTLIVLFFTLRSRNLNLNVISGPMKVERNDSIALTFFGGNQFSDFTVMQQ